LQSWDLELAAGASWKRGVAERGIAHDGTTLQKRTQLGKEKRSLQPFGSSENTSNVFEPLPKAAFCIVV